MRGRPFAVLTSYNENAVGELVLAVFAQVGLLALDGEVLLAVLHRHICRAASVADLDDILGITGQRVFDAADFLPASVAGIDHSFHCSISTFLMLSNALP